jgi:hypothetical protein
MQTVLLTHHDNIHTDGHERIVIKYSQFNCGKRKGSGEWLFPVDVTWDQVVERAHIELNPDAVVIQPRLFLEDAVNYHVDD